MKPPLIQCARCSGTAKGVSIWAQIGAKLSSDVVCCWLDQEKGSHS